MKPYTADANVTLTGFGLSATLGTAIITVDVDMSH
jgi:hypothetical protein